MTGSIPDPRAEAVARQHLCAFPSELDELSHIGRRNKLAEAARILATADAADHAVRVRRVSEAYLRCPGCEQYYDANGVACYRDGLDDDEWRCIDAADEASGVRRVTAQELADNPAAMLREFHAAYGLLVADMLWPAADSPVGGVS